MHFSQFATMFGARRGNIMPRSVGCPFADGYSAPCACICSCHEGRAQYWNQKTQPPRRVAADAHDNVYSAAPYISVCIEQRLMCLSFALASEIFLEKGSTVPLLGTQYTFLNMCLFVLPAIAFACACFCFPGPPQQKEVSSSVVLAYNIAISRRFMLAPTVAGRGPLRSELRTFLGVLCPR